MDEEEEREEGDVEGVTSEIGDVADEGLGEGAESESAEAVGGEVVVDFGLVWLGHGGWVGDW